MAKYEKVIEGEWIEPINGYKFCCCDCGLVHRIEFRIIDEQVEFRTFLDNRATGQVRRHRKTKKHYKRACIAPQT